MDGSNNLLEGSLFPIIIFAVAFMVTKVLLVTGIVSKDSADRIAKVLAVLVGLIYAVTIEFTQFGAIDWLLRMIAGVIVSGVFWVFIYLNMW